MRHPTDGTLRRLMDEPAGVADADREHAAGCPVCLSRLAAAQEDAAAAGAALDVDLDRRRGLGVAAPVARDRRRRRRGRRASGRIRRRWRTALRSPAVAASASSQCWSGPVPWPPPTGCRSSAPSGSRPVAITRADLVELPDLSAYGDLEVTERPTSARSPTPPPRRRRPGFRCRA